MVGNALASLLHPAIFPSHMGLVSLLLIQIISVMSYTFLQPLRPHLISVVGLELEGILIELLVYSTV